MQTTQERRETRIYRSELSPDNVINKKNATVAVLKKGEIQM